MSKYGCQLVFFFKTSDLNHCRSARCSKTWCTFRTSRGAAVLKHHERTMHQSSVELSGFGTIVRVSGTFACPVCSVFTTDDPQHLRAHYLKCTPGPALPSAEPGSPSDALPPPYEATAIGVGEKHPRSPSAAMSPLPPFEAVSSGL